MAGRLNDDCTYEVFTTGLGQEQQIAPLTDMTTALDFARAKSDTTVSNVTLTKSAGGDDCCEIVAGLAAVLQEIQIRRGGAVVWQGPIAQVNETRGEVKIKAFDRSVWFRLWRSTQVPFALSGVDLGNIFVSYLSNVLLGGLDLGVTIPPGPITGIVTERSATPGKNPASTLVDEIAKTAVPWTMIATSLLLGSQADEAQITLADVDIVGDLALIQDGEAWATRVWQAGDASVLVSAGSAVGDIVKDLIVSDGTIKDTVSAFAAAQTKLSTLGGDTPPVVLSVPTNSALSPEAPVTFGELVPGRRFSVILSDGWCRRNLLVPTIELSDMKVTVGSKTSGLDHEQVAVSFATTGGIVT